MVIGAFVLARLLGLRLLTLEARVVVHEDDGGGSGAIILSQARRTVRLWTRIRRPVASGWSARVAAIHPTGWPAQCSWSKRGPTRSSGPGGPSTEADRASEGGQVTVAGCRLGR